MKKSFPFLKTVFVSSLLLFLVAFTVPDADARAGRGRSFRSPKMQRSYGPSHSSFDSRSNFNNPNRFSNNPMNGGVGDRRGSLFGQNQSSGFLKGMVGGLAGGFIGSMLFRSVAGQAGTVAPAGASVGGGGIGLLEILILAGLGFLLYKFFKSRREASAAAGMGTGMNSSHSQHENGHGAAYKFSPGNSAESYSSTGPFLVDQKSGGWRDREAMNKEIWLDIFFNVQASWSREDLAATAKDLTPEVQRFLQEELDQLKNQGLKNTIDNIAVRQSEVVEDWTEMNHEYVVVKFTANLVDYTVDTKTGNVVDGNKTQSVRFEELWTFAREGMDWKLAGIEQV